MKDILRELYNGEVYPAEQIEIDNESFKEAGKKYEQAVETFQNSLSQAQLEKFEQLKYIKNDYDREYDVLNFSKGFQLGMQLTMAGLEKDRLEKVQTEK